MKKQQLQLLGGSFNGIWMDASGQYFQHFAPKNTGFPVGCTPNKKSHMSERNHIGENSRVSRGLCFLVMNDLIAFTNIASLLIQWEVLSFKSCNCKLEFRPVLPKAISTGRCALNTKMSQILTLSSVENCELCGIMFVLMLTDMDSKDDQWWYLSRPGSKRQISRLLKWGFPGQFTQDMHLNSEKNNNSERSYGGFDMIDPSNTVFKGKVHSRAINQCQKVGEKKYRTNSLAWQSVEKKYCQSAQLKNTSSVEALNQCHCYFDTNSLSDVAQRWKKQPHQCHEDLNFSGVFSEGK